MKKFLFIELSSPTNDAEPAGFTRSGSMIVGLITCVLLGIAYFALKDDPDFATTFTAILIAVGTVLISFFFLGKLSLKLSRSKKWTIILFVISIFLLTLWSIFPLS